MTEPHRRFVVLQHTLAEATHWDLMLDQGEALATWQLPENPVTLMQTGTPAPLPAQRIADHRRAYLDNEGPVSKNRGHVTRLDAGTYELLQQQTGSWTIRLAGTRLIGTFRLTVTPLSSQNWLFQRDEP